MLPTSRTELIDLLSCIGVDLPLQTKLPQEAIEERLRKALDCIQQIGQVLSSTSATSILPIASFQPWPDDSKKPLESVVHRTNWLEVAEGIEKRRLTGDATYVVGSGRILMDLKVQLLNLVKYGKMGKELYIIQDKEEDSSIIVRFINIFAADEKTPVIVVLYYHTTFDAPRELRAFDWVERHVETWRSTGINPFIQWTLPIKSQQLFLRLLEMNAKRVPKDYVVPKQEFESRFKVSFLLPIGPLGVKDSYKLNSNTGCIACGGKADKRCGGCLATYYCSPECQKADWKVHKPTCKSLKGAIWTPIPVKHMEVPKGTIILRWHKHMAPGEVEDVPEGDEPPPDTHGVQPFVLKLQCNSSLHSLQNTGGIMIYDKRHSIDVLYSRSTSDAEAIRLYDQILEKIRREGVGREKLFFWARRTGEWEVSLALNRLPVHDIKW